jgi:hypothetical protein
MPYYSLLYHFHGVLVGASLGIHPLEQLRQDLGDRLLSQDTLSLTDGKDLYYLHKEHLIFPLSSSELILATIPLQLRYYDAPSQLRRQLENLTLAWQQSLINLEDVLIWSHCLSEILGGNTPLLTYPRLFFGTNSLARDLLALGAYLAQSCPLHQIFNFATNKPYAPILLALACFLPTPKVTSLCLAKAARIAPNSDLILSLTGVLCGAYNSSWHLPPTKCSELETQAQGIFVRWLGVTHLSNSALATQQPLGPGGSLQKRAGLKIISQRS